MIRQVFTTDHESLAGIWPKNTMYYCTLCNRPYKNLREATEHAKFCGQATPSFRPHATAKTLNDDDDTQAYVSERPKSESYARGFTDGFENGCEQTLVMLDEIAKLKEERDIAISQRAFWVKKSERPWIGLTDNEIFQVMEMGLEIKDTIEIIINQLKEKN